ncbi:MAG: 4,5-DOPA dioxygenase extradiol [Deltaproteobacteria bacterium]|nr:MAG: 4,5-DOPA dioxygenase extradiol [Deltaproteobacteria bacterium]
MESKKMPVVFFGHGSPMNAIEENAYTNDLKKMGSLIPKPKAVLMVSAHWETGDSLVTGMNTPKTIHDFGGFPKPLYEIQYAAKGSSDLADKIHQKISDVQIDNKWGLDHGTWAVLRHVYPNADIPVLQLSLNRSFSLREHFKLGEKLAFLREEGVLIAGSGNIVHNLRKLDWNTNAPPHEWTKKFDLWVKEKIVKKDFDALIDDPLKTEEGRLSIPTLEHYLPLLYVLGASYKDDNVHFDHEGYQNASMAMRCVRLG